MRRINPAAPPFEEDFDEDVRRLLADLERGLRAGARSASGGCAPLVDVFETDQAVEIHMDAPGVPADSLQVVCKREIVIIAGAKPQTVAGGAVTFRLVEREFGRFARAVRIHAAVDVGRARAVLAAGELRVTLPRIADRRGRPVRIPVQVAPSEDVAR